MVYHPGWLRSRIQFIIFLCIVVLLYHSGYKIIHYYYLKKTTVEAFDAMRYQYNDPSTTQAEKGRIYTWFKVRGRDIDEGHDPDTTVEEWRYIIDYWRQPGVD